MNLLSNELYTVILEISYIHFVIITKVDTKDKLQKTKDHPAERFKKMVATIEFEGIVDDVSVLTFSGRIAGISVQHAYPHVQVHVAATNTTYLCLM